MQLPYIAELIFKQLRDDLTQEERVELETWIHESHLNEKFYEGVCDSVKVLTESSSQRKRLEAVDVKRAWDKVKALGLPDEQVEEMPKGKIYTFHWTRIAVAASIILLLSLSLWFWMMKERPSRQPIVVNNELSNDAKPITNYSKLVLDDGTEILLDSLKSGDLAIRGNLRITKENNGAITYKIDGESKSGDMLYNTVIVPKGSDVVFLMLQDGSKVWLNSESSIRYPIEFLGDERKVEIKGEAYFEVNRSLSAGKNRQFIVSNGDMDVVVLGTKFNVNTYENEEDFKVTLLEGSVKIKNEKSEVIIMPDQQGIVSDEKIYVIEDADVEQVVAWKEGKFVFNHTNIQVIMRNMERWYNLAPTQFESEEMKRWNFNGEISRYNNASTVLKLLEMAGNVKFKVNDRRIVVTRQ